MNVTFMRAVDRWLGVPCCWLLTVVRRIVDVLTVRRFATGSISRVLFVKLAEQGASLLAYAAIQQAIQRVGRENVYFLVFAENRFILEAMQLVPPENIIEIPTGSLGRLMVGLCLAVLRIRRLRPDAAIDFEFFARASAAIVYLSRARIRIGLHRAGDKAPWRGDLMTHRFKYDPDLHTSQLYSAMVLALEHRPGNLVFGQMGVEPWDGELPPFQPRAGEPAAVARTVRELSGRESYSPLVLLNANASDLLPLRRWPSDRYVRLANLLLDWDPELNVAFTGAPNEAEAAGRLVAQIDSRRCFSMAGRTSLRELLVLYGLADVLVTNDSGPAHFAALTPIHVITLFGPETPARFGSLGPRSRIIWKGIDCSPCVDAYNNRLSRCKDNECMQRISVEEVFEVVVEVLEHRLG